MRTFKRAASVTRVILFSAHFAALWAILPTTALAVDLVKGQSLYLIHCSGCHGEKGMSANPEAPSFARGEKLFHPDSALIDVIRYGNNAMPAFMGILQDSEILDVISYAKTLQW